MSYPSASTGLRIGLPLPKTRFDNSSTQPPPPSRFPMGTSPTLSCPHLSAALETHLSSGCLLSHCQGPAQEPIGLRSLKGMEALKAAEFGDGMIILEPSGTQHCRLTEGTRFSLDPMTPGGSSLPHSQNSRVADTRIGQALPSQDTLINLSGLSNNGRELKTLLGNTNSKLKAGATLYTAPVRCNTLCDRKTQIPDKPVTLEQAKTKARVEVDIVLESSVIVQGGILGGHIEVHVRRRSKKEAPVLLADGKVRLIGFELIPQSDESHTFFHFAASLPLEPRGSQKLYASPPDDEGYSQASEGTHLVPFAIELPKSGASGNAKGPLMMSPGVVVRYIAMISVKVKDSVSAKRSIAHFYRDCEVWPYFDLPSVLAPSPNPLQASTTKSFAVLGGGNGKVTLSASIDRLQWISGQNCRVKVLVKNGTKKTVRSLTLTLIRTTTIFKPRPALNIGSDGSVDPDACQTYTTHKAIMDSVLEMGQRGNRRHASAKGWWTGVPAGQELRFCHSILLPPNALSISRGRLLEVEYSIRVTISAGSLSSDIFITLPIRIINFISIDPLARNTLALKPRVPSVSREGETIQPQAITAHKPATLRPRITVIPDPLLPFDESSGLSASRSLRVANPDPLDSVIGLPQSDSDASVYSTEANDGHDSDYHGQTLHATTCERRLGNLDLDPEDPGNSDAEVDFVIGTARLEQQDWACGSDFGSTESGWSSIPSSDEDSTLHPRVFNDPSLANRMEGIGLTSFALGVQEKLVSSDRSPIGRTDTKFNSIVEEEATPRLSYRGPTTVAPMPSVLQISGTGLISSSGGSSLRPARTVKGPRGSRMLPKPPSILMEASGSASVVSSSSSQYIDNTTPFSGVPSRSRTAPGCSRPLSLQAVGRVQSERNPSQSGVRGTVAAFEDRGKKAQRSGGSCT